jgi:hypothetical protein
MNEARKKPFSIRKLRPSMGGEVSFYIAGSDLIPELHFLTAGTLVFFLFPRRPPTVEEKFFVEELPAPPESPMVVPEITFAQPGDKALLPPTKVAYQTFNNCGPATLSMILSFYNISKTQKELAEEMRPYQHPKGDNDDKTIFPSEFVEWAGKFGLKALHRPSGSIELLKLFTTNGIPVVIKTWLKPNEDIGHYSGLQTREPRDSEGNFKRGPR